MYRNAGPDESEVQVGAGLSIGRLSRASNSNVNWLSLLSVCCLVLELGAEN